MKWNLKPSSPPPSALRVRLCVWLTRRWCSRGESLRTAGRSDLMGFCWSRSLQRPSCHLHRCCWRRRRRGFAQFGAGAEMIWRDGAGGERRASPAAGRTEALCSCTSCCTGAPCLCCCKEGNKKKKENNQRFQTSNYFRDVCYGKDQCMETEIKLRLLETEGETESRPICRANMD